MWHADQETVKRCYGFSVIRMPCLLDEKIQANLFVFLTSLQTGWDIEAGLPSGSHKLRGI
jgi:hypothetical protein